MEPVYFKHLNDHCRKYFVTNNLPEPNRRDAAVAHLNVTDQLSSLFLMHDSLSLKVYGENIPLVVLFKQYGMKALEELLDQKAFSFILWSPSVMYVKSEIKGVNPIVSGSHTTPAHSDPEQSLHFGFQWANPPLKSYEKRLLIKKCRDIYQVPPVDIAHQAARLGNEGYKENRFKSIGLINDTPLDELSESKKKILCGFAEESLELSVLSHFKINPNDDYRLGVLLKEGVDNLKKASSAEAFHENVFKIEGLPHFKEMLRRGIIHHHQVPSMRGTRNAKKFRKWVAEASGEIDSSEMSKIYIDEITKKGFFDTNKGKLTRFLSVTAISGAIGGAIGGPGGLMTGTVAAPFADKLVDPAIGLLDTFLLDGLLNGWNPRLYIEKEIRPLAVLSKPLRGNHA